MLFSHLSSLRLALENLHAADVKTHMPFVFDDNTFLCCLSEYVEFPKNARIWRAHYWQPETNVFKPVATGFSPQFLECAPHAYRDDRGTIHFSVVSDATGVFHLHTFSGETFDNLTPVMAAQTANAGALTSKIRVLTAKFIEPTPGSPQIGAVSHTLVVQNLLQPNRSFVFVVKNNLTVLNVSPVKGDGNKFTLTLAAGNVFTALLVDPDYPVVAHRIVLSDGSSPYKAHLADKLLFYAQKNGQDFEDRRIMFTAVFDLVPVRLFDYLTLADDFLYNPVTAPPGM